MPFGKYAGKSVQAMEGLFGVVGGLGNKSATITREQIIQKGMRRSAMAGGGLLAGGMISHHRSSARNGLAPRSSAPPPGQSPFGY